MHVLPLPCLLRTSGPNVRLRSLQLVRGGGRHVMLVVVIVLLVQLSLVHRTTAIRLREKAERNVRRVLQSQRKVNADTSAVSERAASTYDVTSWTPASSSSSSHSASNVPARKNMVSGISQSPATGSTQSTVQGARQYTTYNVHGDDSGTRECEHGYVGEDAAECKEMANEESEAEACTYALVRRLCPEACGICKQPPEEQPAAAPKPMLSNNKERTPTAAGCTCKDRWGYKDANGEMHAVTGGKCAAPDGDPGGEWCFLKPSTECLWGKPAGHSAEYRWDYCHNSTSRVPDNTQNTEENAPNSESQPQDENEDTAPAPGDEADSVEIRTLQAESTWVNDSNAIVTRGSCKCKSIWGFVSGNDGRTEIYQGADVCANPDNDEGGPWCFIQPNSCTDSGKQPAGLANSPGDDEWDYCQMNPPPPPEAPPDAATTAAGCTCKDLWGFEAIGEDRPAQVFMGGKCANPDGDDGGPWCFVVPDTCTSTPAGPVSETSPDSWDYCNTQNISDTNPTAEP